MKKKQQKKRRDLLRWQTKIGFVAMLDVGSRRLGCSVNESNDRWGLMALEMPAAGASVHQVLASHAHEYIGEYKDLYQAMSAAERYARKWLKAQEKKPDCPCGPIKKPRRRAKSGARSATRRA